MRSASLGKGLCTRSASLIGAVSHSSISSGLVRMTGIAFGWIGATMSLGSVVKKAKRSLVVSPSLIFRIDVHVVHMPAKKASGLVSSSVNQTGGREPFGRISFSEKLVNGTMQQFPGPNHRRQCGEAAFRTFVTPGSVFLPASANAGDGMPHRPVVSSRTPSEPVRTTGAK